MKRRRTTSTRSTLLQSKHGRFEKAELKMSQSNSSDYEVYIGSDCSDATDPSDDTDLLESILESYRAYDRDPVRGNVQRGPTNVRRHFGRNSPPNPDEQVAVQGFNENVIVHMFLPKVTPTKQQAHLELIEESLLHQVADAFAEATNQITALRDVTKMLEAWKLIQPRTDTSVKDRQHFIAGLNAGTAALGVNGTIPIYVRQQNCTLLISKVKQSEEEHIRVQTYRSSLPSVGIMSNVGSCKFNFPETSDLIENIDALNSELFAMHLYELTHEAFDLAMGIKEKGGSPSTETRDVPKPFLVSDWAVGNLIPRKDTTFHTIAKKVRDQVTLEPSAKSIPFRRAGMWMSIKVALQLKILEALGGDAETTRLVYKTVMLSVLVNACEKYHEIKEKFDLDLASQMLAKVGRRVRKLQKLKVPSAPNTIMSDPIELMRFTILKRAYAVLAEMQNTIQNLWSSISDPSSGSANESIIRPIFRTDEEFMNDRIHHIPKLDEFAENTTESSRNSIASQSSEKESKKKQALSLITKTRRYSEINSIAPEGAGFGMMGFAYGSSMARVWLHDRENFIKTMIDSSMPANKIFKLGVAYAEIARNTYIDNPVGLSQTILASLKILRTLDEIATKKYPLLRKYKPDINSSNFDCLLLPHLSDMKLLDETLDYFRFRQEKASSGRSILERDVDTGTFSVCFATTCQSMMDLKSKIQEDVQAAINRKFEEVDRARSECQDLLQKINALGSCSCEYISEEKRYYHKYYKDYRTKTVRRKVNTCTRCKLQSQLENRRRSVWTYENPLPTSDKEQNAVVFELLIPEEISYLRQFLAKLKYELLGNAVFTVGPNEISKCWLDYSPMRSYTSESKNMVQLGSMRMPSSHTYHTRTNCLDVLFHSNQNFIVNNGMDCKFHYEERREAIKNLKEACTFNLKKAAGSEPYQSLQKYLASTEHTQNEVIANKSDCHPKLFIEEFIKFGSLRGGHRIQLRNLYEAISSQILSLEQESVLILILQTLWEVGPMDEEGRRESHLDFQDPVYSIEFLEMLEKVVNSNKANYSIPLILMTAILITGRIQELNESCSEKCLVLFRKWRKMAKDWSEKIDEEFKKAGNSEENIDSIKKILLEIKLCSLLTYNVAGPNQLSNVINKKEDMVHFLYTLTTHYQLSKESNPNFSSFMSILQFIGNTVPLSLQLEVLIKSTPVIHEGLVQFVDEKCNPAQQNRQGIVFSQTCPESKNIFLVEYPNNDFSVLNVNTGELLVNGYPKAELSSHISGNKDFIRFFQKHLNFRVQRMSENVLQTSYHFHGKYYEFITKNRANGLPGLRTRVPLLGSPRSFADVLIIELQEGSSPIILVPHETFKGYISDHFIDNYTHWIDPEKNVVYFRRISSDTESFNMHHEFVLTNSRENGMKKGWILEDAGSEQVVLSIKSEGFQMLTGAFSRLELSQHMNVLMEKDKRMTVQLIRHNLRFTLKQDGTLESVEYPGFLISEQQGSIGTFVGLRSGLLLETRAKRRIIIPHGRILKQKSSKDIHQTSSIDLATFSNPSFFIYEVDEVLQQIKAKKSTSAWLYLAALHAATSSSQPDPFTGVTGTEMAVNTLQSARVWSCAPYDKECLVILRFIQSLSPLRNYYGHQFRKGEQKIKEFAETTTWPDGLPSMAAYDGFLFIVDKLLEDSLKLINLNKPSMNPDCTKMYAEIKDVKSTRKLNLRSYYRHLSSYNDAAHLSESIPSTQYFGGNNIDLQLREDTHTLNLQEALTTAYARYVCDISIPLALSTIPLEKNTLIPFLLTNDPIYTAQSVSHMSFSLENLFNYDFRTYWLTLYSIATNRVKQVGKQEFNALLIALAYRGMPIEQISILHHITVLTDSGKLKFPPVLFTPNVEDPTRYGYYIREIANTLNRKGMPFPKSSFQFEDYNEYTDRKEEYKAKIQKDCNEIARNWEKMWPCEEIKMDETNRTLLKNANVHEDALTGVNSKIKVWYRALKLKEFIESVQEKLNEAVDLKINELDSNVKVNIPTFDQINISVHPVQRSVPKISLMDMALDLEESELAKEAEQIFKSGKFGKMDSQDECESKVEEIQEYISQEVSNTPEKLIFQVTGLAPRLNPESLLRILVSPDQKDEGQSLSSLVGALGVLWTILKRAQRCLYYEWNNQTSDLERELENPGHENWSPEEYPQWLLLELELDIMIRPVQIEVAEQMMNMPKEKNGVMQLNMGEGKTSVIVPMLCSVLATADSLCRVTVLSSIFKMNWAILKFTIGGLLNQRVYTIPCRRDMDINESLTEVIQNTYEECLNMQGVVLTLPEYRLSFRLLAYDKIKNKEMELGLKLLDTENWLRKYARDILDESDELLGVKYQLVYTIGEQVEVDGGDLRWTLCQKILDIVQATGTELLKIYGSTVIEYDEKQSTERPHEFTNMRLLTKKEDQDILNEFQRLTANKFLEEVMLPENEKELVRSFLLKKEIQMEEHADGMAVLNEDPDLLRKILLLSGYLRRDVLSLALTKRWRVEYGVDPRGLRQMAVPFRAKDVAADRTEFGHPDLAIILTHLSYYYSGLSDANMEEVFLILRGKRSPDAIFREWIAHVPDVPESVTEYNSLNLKDAFQKAKVFHLLRKHKTVIDFWLSHTVFPKESKQFPGKLVMTAWDLVYERQRHPVTGFSGTNDSIVLLPLTISQQDLEKLKGTNEESEGILKQPENHGHRGLHMGVTCHEILTQMKEDELKILIDAGALMLECDNEQVAKLWLEIDHGIEAVVYFNKSNELMVKVRDSGQKSATKYQGRFKHTGRQQLQKQAAPSLPQTIPDIPFELSSYQGRLEKCGVFLDDQHTRGTDLKFPMGSKACVTIGSRMKREKLLQACMRMRKLGKGHSVAFYLSHEAKDKISRMSGAISTKAVLEWVNNNTKEFNDDALLYWAISGKNYAQRLLAEDNFNYPKWKELGPVHELRESKASILAEQCVDQEVTKLMEMYGQYCSYELLVNLIPEWFDFVLKKLQKLRTPPQEIIRRFIEIRDSVRQRCLDHVPEKLHFTCSVMMEEEQEKELEVEKETEVEEERQVERPRKYAPARPFLHENVVKVLKNGEPFQVMEGIMRISDIFLNTNFFPGDVQPDCWETEVYATKDFISTMQLMFSPGFVTNAFLRPIEFMASRKQENGTVQILLLSPYEVNQMLPYFRSGLFKCPLHMFSVRRFLNQDILLDRPRLQLPPPPFEHINHAFSVLGSGSREMAALMVASGCLYFNSMNEQKAFAKFLSLHPQPWDQIQAKLFQRCVITQTGFLRAEHRIAASLTPLGFLIDPTTLVHKILDCRHQVVTEVSHLKTLLDQKAFVKIKNEKRKIKKEKEDENH